ncbi:MAG: HAMP domain-containing histidine kinase [Chloroflexi bacterium]|nr:HAMP domain-containing histidine kinase [Chloroflexota bacterium]
MMNQLWVRLSLAFTAVTLISFSAIMLIILLAVRTVTPQPLRTLLQNPGSLPDQLADFYETEQSWDHVELIFWGAESLFLPGVTGRIEFTLIDLDGQLIYATNPEPSPQFRNPVSIEINGVTQAYLTFWRDEETIFLTGQIESLLLLVAFVGTVIGVLFGILMSRTLTAPLDHLVAAARAIGARDLSRRVKINGTGEVLALADAFNEMAAELEQNEKLRRNLVADIAHELRTPLTGMQGNLYAILDDTYPLTKAEVAGIYEQTRLLSRLVNDLHELSQAEARQLPLVLHPTDLGPSLREWAAAFMPQAESRAITLALDIPVALPLVCVDSQRLQQVIANLLGNALKHTPADGVVTLAACAADGGVAVSVTDTGRGIPPEHLPHIFERFYRVDAARSRSTGGAGLGLAIARAIVTAHDGRISAVSSGIPGEGTIFRLWLPPATHDPAD